MNPKLISTGIEDLLPMTRGGDPRRHISYIIRSLCLKLGHFEDDNGGPDQTRLELGCAFEDAVAAALSRRYAKAHPERFIQPDELERDGLIGNVDLLDVDDWAVIEIKLTWISSRHEPDSIKFWKYWVQLKAYCYMLDTDLGRLHVGHVNGDYRAARGPVYNVWEDRFTRQELVENWLMLKSQSDALMRSVHGKR